MNLQENIHRIKEVMGLLVEQDLILPHKVPGSHTAPEGDCDAIHGFQLARIGSDMNGIVKTELDKFSNQKVWVSNVEVSVNGREISWTVTIDKSDDGEFWNGFTSRGAGCNDNIKNRWNSESVGNGPESIKAKIISSKTCKNVKQIELIKKIEFLNLGKDSFIQGFYRYKCGDETQQNIQSYDYTIKGTDINDLREKLKQQTKDISIDTNTIVVDINNYTVKFKKGDQKIKVISLIFSDSGELETVYQKARASNPTLERIDRGKIGNIDWLLSVIN
jgi:hypothetical protein